MAVKTAFVLLACVILVAITHSHAKIPAQAPAQAPAHAPTKHHHVPPPKKAPIHTPAKHPVHPPLHGCMARCDEYCKPVTVSHKRPCTKVCTACCAKYKCVPVGSKKCTNWGRVVIHGEMVKCPKVNL